MVAIVEGKSASKKRTPLPMCTGCSRVVAHRKVGGGGLVNTQHASPASLTKYMVESLTNIIYINIQTFCTWSKFRNCSISATLLKTNMGIFFNWLFI